MRQDLGQPAALDLRREDGHAPCVHHVGRPEEDIAAGLGEITKDEAGKTHYVGLVPHDLRHTAASLLLSQGVAGRVVMEILGHSQIALTMNTYSHVAPELSRDAFVLWDLIHDRTHSHGDLPFDPFMIRQRSPYWMYSLEELRCDLTAFAEAVKLEQGDLAEAWREGGVEYATVAMRFALTDSMVERASGRTVEGGAPGESVASPEELASVIERAVSQWGLPNGYILGEEGSGAFVAGLRYGEGTLSTLNAGDLHVFWQGPSVGFDWGGRAACVAAPFRRAHGRGWATPR